MPGNDIDTDRIIPARFLKAVTFEGMGEHAFEDARKQNPEHPFNSPAYQGASVLVVGPELRLRVLARARARRRSCAGASAPSWAARSREIFFGNCTMLGIPCLRSSTADVDWLQRAVGARSARGPSTVDVERQEVRFGDRDDPGPIPDGARNQLVSGTWNATGVLLEAGDAIERTARALPYVSGF